jgi:hypothetical protein
MMQKSRGGPRFSRMFAQCSRGLSCISFFNFEWRVHGHVMSCGMGVRDRLAALSLAGGSLSRQPPELRSFE